MSTKGRNANVRATTPFGDRIIEVMRAAAVTAKPLGTRFRTVEDGLHRWVSCGRAIPGVEIRLDPELRATVPGRVLKVLTTAGQQIRTGDPLLPLHDIAAEDRHASLAKAFCTAKSRETVSWGREVLGGNGIVADYNVARFFADAEALYSYEGTYQMQNLIVGKAITGHGAFI